MARDVERGRHKPATNRAIQRGIGRLDERVAELEAFDPTHVVGFADPGLTALSASIRDTLEQCFGNPSNNYNRFFSAGDFVFMQAGHRRPDISEYQLHAASRIKGSIILLRQAQKLLRESMDDSANEEPDLSEVVPSRKVFIVHGHDEGARESVARFLTRINFEPVILHEQPNQSRSIAEKLDHYGDVGFAVVLLTPDDYGAVLGTEPLQPRARQNVILELGFFIGKLTRPRVCALKRGEIEIPSDFLGIAYTDMDEGGGWHVKLARELEAAGYDIDWQLAMSLR